MNILLVYPTCLDEHDRPIKYRQAFFPPLALAILAGLTPPPHTVTVVNEIVEPLAFDAPYDLVGITAMTSQSERAYQIADAFRARGVPVVLGGIHPTALPEEAQGHADAVVVGEAEPVWEQVLDDCEQRRLRPVYQATSFPALDFPARPRWDRLNLKIYPRAFNMPLPDMPFYATRGCPFACAFCSVSKFFGRRYRVRPIAHVLRELDELPTPYRFFVDDNLAGDVDYARELFRAMARRPARFAWGSQISATVLDTPDVLELAAKAGCVALIVGLESLNPASLRHANKRFNHVERYAELFARLWKLRITPYPNLMFGFDDDPPDQCCRTVAFLRRHHVRDALFWVLTPYPGTDLFAQMQQEGRIEHRRWSRYDAAHVVFRLKHQTPAQFYATYWQAYQQFYSWRNFAAFALHCRLRHLPGALLGKSIVRRKIYACEHPTALGTGAP